VFLAVFVDDILIACANNKILLQVKQEFHSRFEMTHLGLAQEFLGIRIISIALISIVRWNS
jgi:hypothetical protein